MESNSAILCPLENGTCAKELKSPLGMDEELLCFYREKEFRKGKFKEALLDFKKLGWHTDPKKKDGLLRAKKTSPATSECAKWR